MRICFKTKKLQKECSHKKVMIKCYGKMATKLAQRLSELSAADSLQDISYLPPPRLHELTGNLAGQFSVDLDYPYRLLFVPAHDPVPELGDGGIDRSQVTEIEIIKIENTHKGGRS